MAEFNKDEYWANRNAGLRGQGPSAKLSVTISANGKISNRTSSRGKFHNGHMTNGHALQKTEAVQDAINKRVRRQEAGEQARVAKSHAL